MGNSSALACAYVSAASHQPWQVGVEPSSSSPIIQFAVCRVYGGPPGPGGIGIGRAWTQRPLTWDSCSGRPARVQAAAVARAGMAMVAGPGSCRLFPGEHGLGFALQVDVWFSADVDGDAVDGASGECVRMAAWIV